MGNLNRDEFRPQIQDRFRNRAFILLSSLNSCVMFFVNQETKEEENMASSVSEDEYKSKAPELFEKLILGTMMIHLLIGTIHTFERRMKMSMRLMGCLVLSLALTCGGCATGIHVIHVAVGDSQLKGVPWNLPMTQFKVTITRHVTGCGENLSGSVEAIATPTTVLDEQQRYVLDSNGWWATSDITSNLAPNGVSTGLNAQSVDATATIISNVVGTVGQFFIAGAAAARPAGVGPAPEIQNCKPDVAAAVAELYPPKGVKLKDLVDQDIAALAAATARVTLLTAQAKEDKSYKKDLAAALGDQDKLQSQLTSDQVKLTKDMNLTTNTQVVSWPLSAAEFRRDKPYVLDKNAFSKWALDGAYTKVMEAQFSVFLALYRQNQDPADGTWILPKPPAISDVSVGVPVRLAQIGRLLICTNEACDATLPEGGSKNPKTIVLDQVQVVLQMGQLYTVPLTGGTFKAENAVIALDTSGLPTSIEVSEKVAAGVALTGAVKDTATQLATLPAQIRSAQLARTQAQTNQLTAEAALANAQANAGVAGQTSALASLTALINAQTALATAQANAGIPLQTSGLAAQTALLNAQAALANAQANAGVAGQTSALAAQTTLINAQAAQINAAAALAKANTIAP